MNTSRQALFDSSTASRANLRSAVGIYLNKLSTSVLCFVRKDAHELSPTNIANTTSKVVITNHIFDTEVFNRYSSVILNQIVSYLMSEVCTLSLNLEMFLCQEFDSLAPIVTAFLFTRDTSLGNSEYCLSLSQIAWILYVLTIAGHSKGFQDRDRGRPQG